VPDLLICLRAVHFASTLLLVGVLCFRYMIAGVPPPSSGEVRDPLALYDRQLHRIAIATLVLALLSGLCLLVHSAADASDASLGILTAPDVIWTFVAETTFGRAFAVRAVAGTALLVLMLWPKRHRFGGAVTLSHRVAILSAGTVFAASFAWSGHATATEDADGWIHVISHAIHVIAAGAWVGGLLPLALLLRALLRSADPAAVVIARASVSRFSALGIVSVGALVVTGTINTRYLAGTVPSLLGTLYGRLLLIKVAVFVVMLAFASYNRFWLTPRIVEGSSLKEPGPRTAVARLSHMCLAEAALGLGAVGLVAWFGSLPPAIHEDAWWPLPYRLILSAYYDSELRTPTVIATLLAALGAIAVITAALIRRRLISPVLAVAGLATAIILGRDLNVLITEAYPTTFLASPVGFTPEVITSGQTLFRTHCSICHGSSGKGDGPAAATSKVPPADLTADHLYGHTEGDLFWRLTAGVDAVMPAFGSLLDADARWRLVAFVQANADADRLAGLRGRVTHAAFTAPRFSVHCPDGITRNTEDFAGQSLHLVIAGTNTRARLDQIAALARSGTGAKSVVMHLGAERDDRFCSTADRTLIDTLAIYRRGSAEDLDGTEFLIDSSWRLRAMWHKGFGINWIDPTIFRRQIAEMDNPQILPDNLKALNPEYGDMPRYYPGANRGSGYHLHRH
jgi:copper resistance protein D